MQKLAIFVVLLLLAAICGAVYWIFNEISQLYSQAEPSLKLGVITATGSSLAFIINNAIQSARERRARLFEAKREVYGEFFSFFTSFFHRNRSEGGVDEAEIMAALRQLTTGIMTWGSANTINAFNQYQRHNAAQDAIDNKELFRRTELFLRALRKDLGHQDLSLENLAVTKMMIRGDDHAGLD